MMVEESGGGSDGGGFGGSGVLVGLFEFVFVLSNL